MTTSSQKTLYASCTVGTFELLFSFAYLFHAHVYKPTAHRDTAKLAKEPLFQKQRIRFKMWPRFLFEVWSL